MSAIRLEEEQPARLTAHDPRLETWRAFLRAHALLTRRLDEDLRTEEGLTLGEYSALLQVAEAPGRALRMNQLATGIFLSRSGVTRLIDRLTWKVSEVMFWPNLISSGDAAPRKSAIAARAERTTASLRWLVRNAPPSFAFELA